jgi:hypothetical protein
MTIAPLFPPLGPNDPPETRIGAPSDPKSWHVGCMVTQGRAHAAAATLYPEEVTDGSDCRAEVGREGEPCRACAAANERWTERVRQVRAAMMAAFR